MIMNYFFHIAELHGIYLTLELICQSEKKTSFVVLSDFLLFFFFFFLVLKSINSNYDHSLLVDILNL